MNWQEHVEHLVSIRKDTDAVNQYLEMLADITINPQYDRTRHNDDNDLWLSIGNLVKEYTKSKPDIYTLKDVEKYTERLVKIIKSQRDNDYFFVDNNNKVIYHGFHLGADQCGGLEIAMILQDVMTDYYESIGCGWSNG